LVRDPTPAGGDDLEDLIGGAQTRRRATGLEAPLDLIIPLTMRRANPLISRELGDHRG